MKEKVICYIMNAMDFLQQQIFTIFKNQYCSNLLKNPAVRGLRVLDVLTIPLKQ